MNRVLFTGLLCKGYSLTQERLHTNRIKWLAIDRVNKTTGTCHGCAITASEENPQRILQTYISKASFIEHLLHNFLYILILPYSHLNWPLGSFYCHLT